MKPWPIIQLGCYNFDPTYHERRFTLPCYTHDCKLCKGEGIIEFKQNERTYPNAPCPACRYKELQQWLARWYLDYNIAPWLWRHYRKQMKALKRTIAKPYRYAKHKVKTPEDPDQYLPKTDEPKKETAPSSDSV